MTQLGAMDIFAVTLTVVMYVIAQLIQQRSGWLILNPILIATAFIMLILKISNVSYEEYAQGSQLLVFFLKPAIVALGIPLYLQLEKIRKQAVPILISQVVACVSGVLSAVWIAQWLGANKAIIISLSPKSATTPIAIEVTQLMGGLPALTAIIVIVTGILGAICGESMLKLFRIHNRVARGLAMGAAAHAVGTAHTISRNRRIGAYSSVGLILNGTLTGLLTPYILNLMGYGV